MRYKVTAMLNFEIEGEINQTTAIEKLNAILPKNFSFGIHSIEKIKSRKREPIGEFALEDVLPYVTEELICRDYIVGDKTYSVRMNSIRYLLFRESLKCVSCGLEGVKFFLESSGNNPHFNLYAVEDGHLVLMTKDHKIAASNGGATRFENLQIMCSICNCLKSNHNLIPLQVAELRKIYSQKRRGVSIKAFNKTLHETRLKMELQNTSSKKIIIPSLLTTEAGYNTSEVGTISTKVSEENVMCDSATQLKIDSVIDELTKDNIMFTAMDAVRSLWANMGNSEDDQWPRGFYADHKNDIHTAMFPKIQNGVYMRELRNVGAPTMAYVYYPTGDDPSNYKPLPRKDAAGAASAPSGVASMAIQAIAPVTPVVIQSQITDGHRVQVDDAWKTMTNATLNLSSINASAPNDTGDASNGYRRSLTQYKRLCVPNALMRAAGFQVGDSAHLEVDTLAEVRLVKNSQARLATAVHAAWRPVATYIVDEDCNARIVGGALAKAGLDVTKDFTFKGDATKVVIANV